MQNPITYRFVKSLSYFLRTPLRTDLRNRYLIFSKPQYVKICEIVILFSHHVQICEIVILFSQIPMTYRFAKSLSYFLKIPLRTSLQNYYLIFWVHAHKKNSSFVPNTAIYRENYFMSAFLFGIWWKVEKQVAFSDFST